MLEPAILRGQHQEFTQRGFGRQERQACRLCRSRWPCDVIQLLDALEAAEREVREKAASGCPCAYTEPCQKQCTCANPASSVGCARCCSYGSVEQRKLNAQRMEAAERSLREMVRMLEYVRANISEYTEEFCNCQDCGAMDTEPHRPDCLWLKIDALLKRPDVAALVQEG